MAHVSTYLNFAGTCEEAFETYRAIFQTDYSVPISRFADVPPSEDMPPIPEDQLQKVMNVQLPITGGHLLMGSDVPAHMDGDFVVGKNVYICLHADDRAECDRLFAALSENGEIEMPMSEMFWGDYYGMCTDRFGTQWMITTSSPA